MHSARLWRATALVCAVCTYAAHASAQDGRTSSLSWVRTAGAEECVSTPVLARSVEERLGRATFVSAAEANVSVEGMVRKSQRPLGFTATITLRDATGATLGTREIHRDGADCHVLDAPLALVIAVMIDPDGKRDEPELPAPAPAPTPAPAPPPRVRTVIQERVVVVHAPEKPAPTPWRFDAGASVMMTLGLLPNPGLGVQASGLLEPPGFPAFQGYGGLFFDRSREAPGAARAAFSLALLGGGICPLRHHGGRFHAYGCVHGQLGFYTSHGEGFPIEKSSAHPAHVAGAVDGRVSLRVVGPFSVRAGAAFVVPLLRPRFVYTDPAGVPQELFRVAPVGLLADVGLGLIFP